MKISNLYRVELYRFLHSMSIIKYAILIPLVLFLMSYINIAYLGDEITGKLVWASMASDFPYLLALICTIIAVYVGREFRQKTINYEIMRGYSFCKIALSKTITCGIIIPAIILMCMMIYLGIFSDTLCRDFLLRILCMFALLFHLCSSTTLYVLLCRNSAIGGCLAFARFLVIGAALQMAALHLASDNVETVIMGLMVSNQWYELISVEAPLPKELIISILVMSIVEYGMLQGVLAWWSKRSDM